MSRAAVVLAGGSGTRAGLGRNKTLAPLGDSTVLTHAVAALAVHVDRVVVVARAADRAAIRDEVGDLVHAVVDGGATRHDSERAGLAAVGDVDVVAFHDGARPLVPAGVVERVLDAAADGAAVVPALSRVVPVAVWREEHEGGVLHDARLVDRRGLVGVQTPQAAPLALLRAAFDAAAAAGDAPGGQLDTVEPVLRHLPDAPVLAVDGDPRNLKVTWRADLALAARLLEDPDAPAPVPGLHRREGWPTGGAPPTQLEVDGVVPVTDALRLVRDGRVHGAVDRHGLVDVAGDLLAVPGVLDEAVEDPALAVEAAVAAGARLRLRRRR